MYIPPLCKPEKGKTKLESDTDCPNKFTLKTSVIIKNKFGEVKILSNNMLAKSIGISMSGGADSTMLCYLLAKSISNGKLNISIQPYNGYDINLPGDSNKIPFI